LVVVGARVLEAEDEDGEAAYQSPQLRRQPRRELFQPRRASCWTYTPMVFRVRIVLAAKSVDADVEGEGAHLVIPKMKLRLLDITMMMGGTQNGVLNELHLTL
jgi:hypothetical protein